MSGPAFAGGARNKERPGGTSGVFYWRITLRFGPVREPDQCIADVERKPKVHDAAQS